MRRARADHARTPARRPHRERTSRGPQVFVVGAGRLGGALALGLAAAGWNVSGAWTRTRGRRLPGIPVRTGAFPLAMRRASLVLICVPDRAVARVALDLAPLVTPGAVFAHCAGALDLQPLGPLASAGAEVGSLHPLVSVSRGTDLAGHACALEGSPRAVQVLRRAAAAVGLRALDLPGGARPRYHAAATLAASGVAVLLAESVHLLVGLGVPEDAAAEALADLMGSALDGARRRGLPDALTGPVARGDAAVVQAHLQALAGDRAEPVYRLVAERALEIARAQGSAGPDALRQVARLLRQR